MSPELKKQAWDVILGIVLGLLCFIGGRLTLGMSTLEAKSNEHESRLSVIESRLSNIEHGLDEIKSDVKTLIRER